MFFSGYGKAIKEVRFGASKRLLVFVVNGGIYYRAGGTETKKYRNPEKLRYSVMFIALKSVVLGTKFANSLACAPHFAVVDSLKLFVQFLAIVGF